MSSTAAFILWHRTWAFHRHPVSRAAQMPVFEVVPLTPQFEQRARLFRFRCGEHTPRKQGFPQTPFRPM